MDSDGSLTTVVDGLDQQRSENDLISEVLKSKDFSRLGSLVGSCRNPKNVLLNLKTWFRINDEEELCDAMGLFVSGYMSTGPSAPTNPLERTLFLFIENSPKKFNAVLNGTYFNFDII